MKYLLAYLAFFGRKNMYLLKSDVKKIFYRYLAAAFGSALISSIYGVVDMAMVGKYQGPDGIAALSVVAPIWNIIYSLGLLCGTGGSILLAKAKREDNQKQKKVFVKIGFFMTMIIAAICWIVIVFFDTELFDLFGGDDKLLTLARNYLVPIKYVVPAYLFNQMMAAFLRNDNATSLATFVVLTGGVFNIR